MSAFRLLVRTAFAAVLASVLAWGVALPAYAGGSGSGAGGTSGPDPEMPGEVLVKLRSTAALQPLLARQPLTLVSRFGARPIYRLKVVGAVRVKDVLAALALEPDVMIAEPNTTHRSPEARRTVPWAIGTQSAYIAQWAPQAMRLADAQRITQGVGVRVAVLDTGVDTTHPALAGRLLPGRDFVDGDLDPSEVFSTTTGAWGHGTHVAGLIALAAPGAQIMPLRVLDTDGVGNAWVLAEALLHAIDPDGNPDTNDGVHVINLSLGSLARTRIIDTIAQIASCAPAIADDPIGDRSDPGYADDDRRCANGSNGVVIIGAAGNDASGSLKEYPAAESAYGLVSVASSDSTRHISKFSNSGPWIDLAAPGEGITSAIPGGWAVWSGTSMAAPLVAGAAALVRGQDLSVRPSVVVRRLKQTASVLCSTNLRQVDAYAAVINVGPQSSSCR
jgi:subtilisin family serine protease